MADWGYFPSVSRIQADGSGSKTQVNGSGSANAKGAWTQLLGSTNFDVSGILMQIQCSNGPRSALIDIGVGGSGSEVVVIPNIFLASNSVYAQGVGLYIPFSAPAGSRVAARLQSNASAADLYFNAQFFATNGLFPNRKATDYGSDTGASKGTTLTAGSGGSKGSWAQLTASCGAMQQVLICVGDDASPGAGLADFFIDIGIGGSGSEVVLVPDLYIDWSGNSGNMMNPPTLMVPLAIASGTRIAARTSSSTDGATVGINLIGFG